HGCLPLPAPAVLELLSGVPVRPVEIDHEIVTPTGAAIVRTLAEAFGPFPPMRIERTGYGAGTHQGGEIPNLLRIVIGEGEGQEARGGMLLMEANIDDMNPQGYDHVLERLFEAGAADAYLSPIQMKKNRPAVLLSVLLPEGRKEPIARILFEETTTIGLRFHPVARITLDRHVEEVETPFGRIPVKIARQGGEVMNLAPEYDACKAAAIGHSVPLKRIYLAVWEALARSGLSSQSSGASSAPSSGDPSTLSGTGQSRSR
ncbi:MAG: LarC family nickel insertion protein, partial [Deltaproteobacteria bacterium]